MGGLVWLQLWLWHPTNLHSAADLRGSHPFIHALRDADTLLRRFAGQETLRIILWHEGPIQIVREKNFTTLYAPDSLTATAGLYALLEEKWGLAFVHPQHTVQTPHLRVWDTLTLHPRFGYRGFHLHTQHPIELTEPLHDPDFPQGEMLIRQYIDWLIRNKQNYFEFCLLRTVDLKRWLPYFTRIVEYARTRGIEVGLDLSLRMQQQRAFQLMPRWRRKGKTLRFHLEKLSHTGITRLNVDLNAAEFVGKAWGSWIDSLLGHARQVGLKVMSRQHVVPPEAYAVGDFHPSELPPDLTLCVHSVMCYGLQDSFTPVYRCKNFSHLYRSILEERERRSVWYYPESAYWVTFDNSVPVWLLSYLRSRLEDILLVENLVEGHLTFSSGWDVGYWLFDWSIARWSWRYWYNGEEAKPFPAEGFVRLFGGDTMRWQRLIRFQDSVLVGRNVLSYITPTTPIDEISWTHLPSFQPRLPVPPWRVYRHPARYRPLFAEVLTGMREALRQWPLWYELPVERIDLQLLYEELKMAWTITQLRVAFRYYWLEALVAERCSPEERAYVDSLYITLQGAERVISRLPVRYPLTVQRRICRAGKRPCRHPYPAYRFGYLYPAMSLHFWRREIGQVESGRWGVLYRNLWDMARITGLW